MFKVNYVEDDDCHYHKLSLPFLVELTTEGSQISKAECFSYKLQDGGLSFSSKTFGWKGVKIGTLVTTDFNTPIWTINTHYNKGREISV